MVVFACKRKLIKSRLADGLKIVTFYLALNRPNFDRKKKQNFFDQNFDNFPNFVNLFWGSSF